MARPRRRRKPPSERNTVAINHTEMISQLTTIVRKRTMCRLMIGDGIAVIMIIGINTTEKKAGREDITRRRPGVIEADTRHPDQTRTTEKSSIWVIKPEAAVKQDMLTEC